MGTWLRIDGMPASEIGAHSPPTWETWADGGTGSISWDFSLSVRSQHQSLRPGVSFVEVVAGCVPVAAGILSEYDRTTRQCVAYGLASEARKYLALDGGGSATRDIVVAIEQAQIAGWRASNPSSYDGVVPGDTSGQPVTLGQLFDELAQSVGRRWGVDGRRRLYFNPDSPAAVTWLATPQAAAFGATSEDAAKTLKGRYLDSGSSAYATATAGDGSGPQAAYDLTDRGPMSLAEATAVLEGILTLNMPQNAWTNGVELTREQLQTMGGTPAHLASITAGYTVATLGFAYGGSAFRLNTIIGKTRYTAGEDSIYIEPVNTAPRTVSDVLAAS